MHQVITGLFLFICSATAAAATLPGTIVRHMNVMAEEGTCEVGWPQLADDVGDQSFPLEDGKRLRMVPCSRWALNTQFVAFVEIPESTRPDGFIYHPLLIKTYGMQKEEVVKPVVPFMVFSDGILLAQEFFISGSECGTRSRYKWDPAHETLEKDLVMENTDCRHPTGTWEQVFPARSAQPNMVSIPDAAF